MNSMLQNLLQQVQHGETRSWALKPRALRINRDSIAYLFKILTSKFPFSAETKTLTVPT